MTIETVNPYVHKESLIRWHGEIIVSKEVLPVRSHQAQDDYFQKEKDLGSILRFQRDRDGRLL